MKKNISLVVICYCALLLSLAACGNSERGTTKGEDPLIENKNIIRAINMVDASFAAYFEPQGMRMSRYYNPMTKISSSETGSVWMYTSAIEAVNAILEALCEQKENGVYEHYDTHYARFVKRLDDLYKGLEFYSGTFELTSYTRTNEWTVYGVNRGSGEGSAEVAGIMNVYDDQMWLVRELLTSYGITKRKEYLERAEYLTEYVLDGWDCTLDSDGVSELGGITWGPGYTTKHSCSNGPIISPLVWLSELYEGKIDKLIRYYVAENNKRYIEEVSKYDYYLDFAKRVYAWQKKKLLRNDGVYADMMGGSPEKPTYITIEGNEYRNGDNCNVQAGNPLSYNSGTMLSGAVDLYRVTGETKYLEDAKKLSDESFNYFAKPVAEKAGCYQFNISGFGNWFNGILMRAYFDVYPYHKSTERYLMAFQNNLDYGYDNYYKDGLLPTNLLVGWNRTSSENATEGMFQFAYVAELAILAKYNSQNK
ncbi:MAG: glycoside hydrolase family 76 protein [Bacteroidales bacterium]